MPFIFTDNSHGDFFENAGERLVGMVYEDRDCTILRSDQKVEPQPEESDKDDSGNEQPQPEPQPEKIP